MPLMVSVKEPLVVHKPTVHPTFKGVNAAVRLSGAMMLTKFNLAQTLALIKEFTKVVIASCVDWAGSAPPFATTRFAQSMATTRPWL